MKIVSLLVIVLILFIGIIKKTADDVQEIAVRTELKQYPNLLPTVEVVAKRLPRT
ncbi:hypothetical protein [Pontibacter qinzhouensis]|uniref:hypothetical protein n=1 Tax=Pontibacter qinzhouensis TaxID=2603253 RepID=UPI00164FFF71|nr:hypothetical protein [Pontibacter qinzhouensis]